MLPCDICGKARHSWFDCPQRSSKPLGWKPERLINRQVQIAAPPPRDIVVAVDLANGDDVHVKTIGVRQPDGSLMITSIKEEKRGKGRPKSIKDMKAYKAQKQREYRAKKDKQP